MRKGSKFWGGVLKMFGWKVQNVIPPDVDKLVVMMAPHTSNWDMPIGWMGYQALGLKARFLVKKEAFFWPLGGIVRWMGGIPVDRQSSNNTVQQVGDMFAKEKELVMTITPEGTRSLNHNWKRGFYYIAVHAKVPIGLGFLDYKKKLGGIGQVFWPTGNYDADIKEIEKFYYNITALYPEKFNLSEENRRKTTQ